MTSYVALAAFFIVTFAAASTGAIFMPGEWYKSLNKPWWTPPDWAFPVVWSILYIMIAIAGWLAWKEQGLGLLVGLWAAQLVFNAAWSWIMFGEKKIALALLDAGCMWIAIAALIALAWPVSSTAALLFAPYLLWATIAFALNYTVLRMNPGA
jgi:tryptophan-rich sensory protein